MAGSGVVAMASALGVEFVVAGLLGASGKGTLVAMLLGAVVGLLGSMALSGTSREKALTALVFPAAIGVGMAAGAAVASYAVLSLAVFVVVMFAAVFVRRFGSSFFFYGFLGWIGYFLVSLLGVPLAALPALIGDAALAAAWVLLLALTVLRPRPARTLGRTLRAFGVRTRAVAGAAGDLLERGDTERRRRRLHSQHVQLTEAALMVEGQLDHSAALPAGWSAAALRQWVIDAQLAIDELAAAAFALAQVPNASGQAGPAPAACRVVRRIADGDRTAAQAALVCLREAADHDADEETRRQARHLATAARDYLDTTGHAMDPQAADTGDHADEDAEFEPAITLMMGNLPRSTAVAQDVPARGAQWNPLARLELTTRQATQAALAGGLAIAAGYALSPTRYYWAAIAAFVAFTGTSTRSETFIKALNRVIGTLAGLWAAVLLARLTAGETTATLAVIFASMFCGLYLMRVSYAYMIFFVTIVVAQLYSVLGRFSDQILLLRLEETAIGAAAGVAVALLVIPLSTRDTARTAQANFFTGLGEILNGAAHRLTDPAADIDLARLTRNLDDQLRQIHLVLRPLTRPLLLGSDPRGLRHTLTLYTACASYARSLTSALRRADPGEGTPAFAEACQVLAAAAADLADAHAPRIAEDPASPSATTHEQGNDTETASDRNRSEQNRTASGQALTAGERIDTAARTLDERTRAPDEPAAHPVQRPLSRLQQVLHELARGSGHPSASGPGLTTG